MKNKKFVVKIFGYLPLHKNLNINSFDEYKWGVFIVSYELLDGIQLKKLATIFKENKKSLIINLQRYEKKRNPIYAKISFKDLSIYPYSSKFDDILCPENNSFICQDIINKNSL